MILGGPGAGKSTFLRRIGLEALKGKEGIYKHQCIPVFLELKQFNSDEVDLVRAISNELQNFGFPSSENFAVKALEGVSSILCKSKIRAGSAQEIQ